MIRNHKSSHVPLKIFLNFFLIEGQLLYHIVLVSAIHQHESAIGIHTEKAMAPHSSTLAWKIPWTEEPGRL